MSIFDMAEMGETCAMPEVEGMAKPAPVLTWDDGLCRNEGLEQVWLPKSVVEAMRSQGDEIRRMNRYDSQGWAAALAEHNPETIRPGMWIEYKSKEETWDEAWAFFIVGRFCRNSAAGICCVGEGCIPNFDEADMRPCQRPGWATPGHDDYQRPDNVWDVLMNAAEVTP